MSTNNQKESRLENYMEKSLIPIVGGIMIFVGSLYGYMIYVWSLVR